VAHVEGPVVVERIAGRISLAGHLAAAEADAGVPGGRRVVERGGKIPVARCLRGGTDGARLGLLESQRPAGVVRPEVDVGARRHRLRVDKGRVEAGECQRREARAAHVGGQRDPGRHRPVDAGIGLAHARLRRQRQRGEAAGNIVVAAAKAVTVAAPAGIQDAGPAGTVRGAVVFIAAAGGFTGNAELLALVLEAPAERARLAAQREQRLRHPGGRFAIGRGSGW
jgi:hypothetical protein